MNGNRIRLSVVASTNLYTTQLLGQCVIDEFTLVSAQFQEQGKGQRGKSWQSNAGENMLSSLVLFPRIKVKNQFLISAATALSLIELLQDYGLIAQIKWPNDILVKGKKIAGILIENQIKGDMIESSVIGVGLNVNQSSFDAFDWEATSISIETKAEVNLEEFIAAWQKLAEEKLRFWIQNSAALIDAFNRKLFLKNKSVNFRFHENELEGEIIGVGDDGALKMKMQGDVKSFVNGEIKLLNTFSG